MDLTLGQVIPLTVQLGGGESNKYPKAVLYDEAGAELDDSPVYLTHVGNGLYKNSAVTMPNNDFVVAQYFIYTDSGHTTLDTVSYPSVLSDVFSLQPASLIAVPNSSTLKGTVTTGDLFAEVEDC